MNCISISYKNAGESIRSAFAFNIDVQKKISENFNECVILCTCNRTEIYFVGEDERTIGLLAEYSGISADSVKRYTMIFHGQSAVSHLFRVTCGIESMVVGEDEILGQVRDAYKNACETGKAGHEINMFFQVAIACAKRIKTETSLSSVSVSTATLTANEAVKFCENPRIMVIGATGKIGSTIVKNILSHRNASVTVTIRNHMADIFTGSAPMLKTVDYRDRYSEINEYDCVISATSGPHYTITYSELAEHLKTAKDRLFIDLSVPHDIDRKIDGYKNIRLIGIDYFEQLAKDNNIRRADSADLAKEYIKKEFDAIEKNYALHCFLNKNVTGENEKKLICKLKTELNAQQFSAVLEAIRNG